MVSQDCMSPSIYPEPVNITGWPKYKIRLKILRGAALKGEFRQLMSREINPDNYLGCP